jgi:hypothetical protein
VIILNPLSRTFFWYKCSPLYFHFKGWKRFVNKNYSAQTEKRNLGCPKIEVENYIYGFPIRSGMTNREKQLQGLLEAVFLFIVIVGLDPTIQRFRAPS